MAYDLIWKKLDSKNYSRDWGMGADFFTTSEDAKAAMISLRNDVNNLNRDITQTWFPKLGAKKTAADHAFVQSWIAWRDGAYALVADALRDKWVPDLAWKQVDRAAGKVNELNDWRRKYEEHSLLKSSAPIARKAAAADDPDAPKDGNSVWKYAALAAGGAALAGLVAMKLKG